MIPRSGIRHGMRLLTVAVGALTQVHRLDAQTILTPPPNRGTVTLLVPGPAPVNTSVMGTPAFANVMWGHSGTYTSRTPPVYSVQRWMESDLTCCNAQVNGLTAQNWKDEGTQWPGTYVYRVTAFHSNGSVGISETKWVRPTPVNPANFRAFLSGGAVYLQWDAVPDISWYEVLGPGLFSSNSTVHNQPSVPGSFQLITTVLPVRNLPPGTYTYSIGSFYASPNAPSPVSTAAALFPKITVTVP
jgi:hypothetical protein